MRGNFVKKTVSALLSAAMVLAAMPFQPYAAPGQEQGALYGLAKEAQVLKASASDAEKPSMESAGFRYEESLSGYRISLEAEKGVLPADTEVVIKEVSAIEDKDIKGVIEDSLSKDAKVQKLVSFDITLYSGGKEIQPEEGKVKVSIELADAMHDALDSGENEVKVFHVENPDAVEEVKSKVKDGTLEYDAEHFSVYTVALLNADAGTTATLVSGAIFNGIMKELAGDGSTYFAPDDKIKSFSRIDNGSTYAEDEIRRIGTGEKDVYIHFDVSSGEMVWWSEADKVFLSSDSSHMFDDCNSLSTLDLSGFDTSRVTDMTSMFEDCSSLTSLDVGGFDTSNVTDMSFMFSGCKGLAKVDVNSFNTHNVENMQAMFQGCEKMEGFDLGQFDTSNVTNMGSMFGHCKSLSAIDVSGFNTHKVTDMDGMFQGCEKVVKLDLSKFDTSNVTDMGSMFLGCVSLTEIDISKFDTSKVTDMQYMFQVCRNITTLDIGNFDTGNVTDVSGMFSGCSRLKTIYTNASFVTEKAKDISEDMFGFCSTLVGGNGTAYSADHKDKEYARIDTAATPGYFTGISAKPNTESDGTTATLVSGQEFHGLMLKLTGSSNEDLYIHFQHDEMIKSFQRVENGNGYLENDIQKASTDDSEKEVYLHFDAETGAMTWWSEADKIYFNPNSRNMFENLYQLAAIDLSGFDTSQVTDMSYMFSNCENLTALDVSKFDTSNVIRMNGMFNGCSSLSTLDVSNFDTSKVDIMTGMFHRCSSLTSLDVSNFDTSNVGSMSNMFFNCSSLTALDISKFDTSSVIGMDLMFSGCSSLTSLDVGKMDTSNVIDISGMFYGCRGLISLDISNFDTGNVRYMNQMFAYCDNLKTIYISSGFTTNKVESSVDMFTDSTSLVGGNGTAYSADHIDKEYARIDTAATPGYFTDISAKPNTDTTTTSATLLIGTDFNKLIKELSGSATMFYDENEAIKSFHRVENGYSDSNVRKISSEDSEKEAYIHFDAGTGELAWWSDADTVYMNPNSSWMFSECNSLASLDLHGLDTSKVTDMGGMFRGCSSLASLDLSMFDTSQVTIMGYGGYVIDHGGMFQNCSSLTSLDLSGFDTRRVERMDEMFFGCSKLTELDLSNFDTSKVTRMWGMFSRCENLKTIYATENYATGQVEGSEDMFANCTSLVGGNGTVYDANHTDKEYARIDTAATPGYFTAKAGSEESSDLPTRLQKSSKPEILWAADGQDVSRYSVGALPVAVKYDPYEARIEVTYTADGKSEVLDLQFEKASGNSYQKANDGFPKDLKLSSEGVLDGMPKESRAEEYSFVIHAWNNDEANPHDIGIWFPLKVLDNSKQNVEGYTDVGYELTAWVTTLDLGDEGWSTMRSVGPFSEFVTLYLDGEELKRGPAPEKGQEASLAEDEDYYAVEGSTICVIKNQTLTKKEGTHTLVEMFKTSDSKSSDGKAVRRASQNYEAVKKTQDVPKKEETPTTAPSATTAPQRNTRRSSGSGSGSGSGGGSSSGGSSGSAVSFAVPQSPGRPGRGYTSHPDTPGTWVSRTGEDGSQNWYYQKEDGSMWSGWIVSGHYWFCLDEDGKMLTGWQFLGGHWYYFNAVSDGTEGELFVDWNDINGKWYFFYKGDDEHMGEMYVDSPTPDGRHVGADGARID